MENISEKSIDFETSLLKFFDSKQVDKNYLSQYTKAIAKIQSSGVEIVDILDRGTPRPDWVLIKGRLKVDKVNQLKDILVIPNLRNVEIFPIGIINPEFELNFKFGNVPK